MQGTLRWVELLCPGVGGGTLYWDWEMTSSLGLEERVESTGPPNESVTWWSCQDWSGSSGAMKMRAHPNSIEGLLVPSVVPDDITYRRGGLFRVSLGTSLSQCEVLRCSKNHNCIIVERRTICEYFNAQRREVSDQ